MKEATDGGLKTLLGADSKSTAALKSRVVGCQQLCRKSVAFWVVLSSGHLGLLHALACWHMGFWNMQDIFNKKAYWLLLLVISFWHIWLSGTAAPRNCSLL